MWKLLSEPFSLFYLLFSCIIDFVAPLDLPKSGSHGNVEVNQEHVIMLEAMGFTREHSIRGLSKTVLRKCTNVVGWISLAE